MKEPHAPAERDARTSTSAQETPAGIIAAMKGTVVEVGTDHQRGGDGAVIEVEGHRPFRINLTPDAARSLAGHLYDEVVITVSTGAPPVAVVETRRPSVEEIDTHARAHQLAGYHADVLDESDGIEPRGGAWRVEAADDDGNPCGMIVELRVVNGAASWRALGLVEMGKYQDFDYFEGVHPGTERFRYIAVDRSGNAVARAARKAAA